MSQMPPPTGAPPTEPMSYQSPPPGAQPSQGLAIGSLVCGILSIGTFCVWWLSVPLGIVAVVLGVMARGKIARGEASGAGLAKAGMICGIIGAVISILLFILAMIGLSMFGKQVEEWERQQRMQQQQPAQTVPVGE